MEAGTNAVETFHKFLKKTQKPLQYPSIPMVMINYMRLHIVENLIKIFLNCENSISFHAYDDSEIRVCKNPSESMPYKYKITVLPMDAPTPGDYSVSGEREEIYNVNIPDIHSTDLPSTDFLPTEVFIYSDTSDIGDIKYGLSQYIEKNIHVDTSVNEVITICSFVNIDYCDRCYSDECQCDSLDQDNPCLVKVSIEFN